MHPNTAALVRQHVNEIIRLAHEHSESRLHYDEILEWCTEHLSRATVGEGSHTARDLPPICENA